MLDEARYDAFLVEREDRLVTITLNRPAALNAMTREAHSQLEEFWHDVADDASVAAIIITGAGRAFARAPT